jgi:site-specific recombinase XerD
VLASLRKASIIANKNPAAGIRLKGTVRGIPRGLLEKAELEALFESYAVKDERTQRNKVILSLLVYQGIIVWRGIIMSAVQNATRPITWKT